MRRCLRWFIRSQVYYCSGTVRVSARVCVDTALQCVHGASQHMADGVATIHAPERPTGVPANRSTWDCGLVFRSPSE